MKLNKCFTTVFDSALKEHGFKRKGVLYYRINGEILQGITIKTTNPYSICIGFIPYWMYDVYWNLHRGTSIDKSTWAEEIDCLSGNYYRQDDQNSVEYMQELSGRIEKDFIPLLNGIRTNDDYLRIKEYYLDPGARISSYIISQYALLQKALQEKSFEESDRLLQKIKDYSIAKDLLDEEDNEDNYELLSKRYYSSNLKTLPRLIKPYLDRVKELEHSGEEYDEMLGELNCMMELHYNKYIAIREKEDFDAIEALYNENLAKMKEEIKIKLKIDL